MDRRLMYSEDATSSGTHLRLGVRLIENADDQLRLMHRPILFKAAPDV